jgi:hypothetical protein
MRYKFWICQVWYETNKWKFWPDKHWPENIMIKWKFCHDKHRLEDSKFASGS